MKRHTFMSDGYYAISGEENFDDQDENYCGEAIDKLAEYEDAEEQGRLVILPYALGTTVYYIHFDKCYDGKCYWFEDGKCIKEKFPEYCPKVVLEAKYDLTMYQNGTRVFLTHEEAEEALKND